MFSANRKNTLPARPRCGKSMLLSALLVSLLTLTGCNGMGVYDDLEECPRGVIMRFVFDYNLEYANSFPNQVDCLSVYLFDSEGNLIERRTETTEVLRDEDWRMTFDLPAGDYQVVAYGGMECDLASFSHTKAVEDIHTISDLEVLMHEEHIGEESGRPANRLHDLYHGIHRFTVNAGTDYDKTTVPLVRDTNNIRIVLQHIDHSPVNDKDFRFEIVDDNVKFNYNNDIIPLRTVTYTPWTTGTASTGVPGQPDLAPVRKAGAEYVPTDEVQVAYADFSVSRLMHKSNFVWADDNGKTQKGPRLRIITREGRIVAELPLTNYLLLLKSEYLNKMDSQEFLDRANNYNLIFFLDRNNAWIEMSIVVDDWTVRINNINDF